MNRTPTRPPPRPRTIEASVCLLCGSPKPDDVAPDCTHPKVARFEKATQALRDLVLRLRHARRAVAETLLSLEDMARFEAGAGHAIIDEDSGTHAPPPNVRFLRPRGELVRDEFEQPVVVRAKLGAAVAVAPNPPIVATAPVLGTPVAGLKIGSGPEPPPLVLSPPKRRRLNPTAAKNLKRGERPVDDATGTLFEPSEPSTGGRP